MKNLQYRRCEDLRAESGNKSGAITVKCRAEGLNIFMIILPAGDLNSQPSVQVDSSLAC